MTGEWGVRAAVVLIAAIVILAAAAYARSFLAPIAFALFIAAIVWPLQSALQKTMPRIAALGDHHYRPLSSSCFCCSAR